MSLFDDASLVLIPDGAKDGKLYSVKPTDGTGDFTFTRGSNLSATRVDENGLIEKGRENLLLQSNQFDTTWAVANSATIVGGQPDKDGGNNAWLLSKSLENDRLMQTITTNNIVNTFSIYLKSNDSNWARIYIDGSSSSVFFDLANGQIGSSGAIHSSIESVGNGWYRCSVTQKSSTVQVRVYPADSNGVVGNTSGSIYIQDAQLEVGLVATDYIETTTTTAVSGITEDLPRIDYSGGASCPSLLLEPQRTNIIEQSEYFGTAWIPDRLETTDWLNQLASPDGTVTATKLIQKSGQTAAGYVQENIAVSAGVYTFSVFAKKGTRNWISLRTNATGSNLACWFNTDTGTIGSVNSGLTAKIEEYPNGWYRCSITCTSASGGAFQFYNTDKNGTLSVADDGGYQYIWGAQVEEGSYPTSYIPTYGTSVTRVNDFCSKNVGDLIGQTEGTLFLDLNVTTIDADSFLFGVYGGGNEIYFRGLGSNVIRFIHYFGGAVAAISTPTLSEGRHKLAACYKNNDWVFYLDGVLVGSDTSGTFSGTINVVSFGYTLGSVYQAFESVNQALLFKTRLSNTELAALTTI